MKRFYIVKEVCAMILLMVCISSYGQRMPIGSWRTHLSYNMITNCAVAKHKVYGVGSGGGLFSVNRFDEGVEIYSKISGLTENSAKLVAYSEKNGLTIVAYNNSNVDFITDDDEIVNLPDLFNNGSINADKSINCIEIYDDVAYLGCAFGIVAINIPKQEIKDTYIIGSEGAYVNVLNISVTGGNIYAMTDNALYIAPQEGVNLLNYQNWERITIPNGDVKNRDMAVVDDLIYIVKENNVMYEANANDIVWEESRQDVDKIEDNNDVLWTIDVTGKVTFDIEGERFFYGLAPNSVEYDAEGKQVWYSDMRGIGRYSLVDETYEFFVPSGPTDINCWKLKYFDGRIYAVPGGRWAVQYNRPGNVMIFDEERWINIPYEEIKNAVGSDAKDFINITPDPMDKRHFYVASWGMGLFEFRDDKPYRVYNAHNSAIETIYPESSGASFDNYHRVDGLSFDKKGNLWISNSRVTKPIKYMDSNGNIKGFSYPELLNVETIQDIFFIEGKDNIKYVLVPRSSSSLYTALYAIDDKGTEDNVYDDITKYYSEFKYLDNGEEKQFKPSNLYCITQDKDGMVWIGTTTGPIRIDNPSRIFDDDFVVTRIKIPRNDGSNLADYLLETEIINAIAVDGSNRKWMATENSGVFLMSADGENTLKHFTSENSPLLSNTVYSIAINEETGEVFFGTGGGIISYQSDAIEGEEKFNNVHAFPNPVREDYHGLVSITGLKMDSRVRITDVNGYLVYEANSNGGIATWDCTRSGGERVATGVYIVMCMSKDGKEYAKTKILVIN